MRYSGLQTFLLLLLFHRCRITLRRVCWSTSTLALLHGHSDSNLNADFFTRVSRFTMRCMHACEHVCVCERGRSFFLSLSVSLCLSLSLSLFVSVSVSLSLRLSRLLAPRAPYLQGWLLKEGGLVKNWKRRWFAVGAQSVFYFETPSHAARFKYLCRTEMVKVEAAIKACGCVPAC